MSDNRRSKLQINLQVLQAVADGINKPTRIMYAANMSWNSAQRVMAGLIEQGLIRMEELPGNVRMKRLYFLTDKGAGALAYYNDSHMTGLIG